jgi:cytochrome c biogenesis protein CcmG, thiol:disulfide interchange protein DsbE
MTMAEQPASVWRRLIVLLPLVLFIGLAGLFFLRLGDPTDRSTVPSALIGRAVPDVTLPPLEGVERDGKPMPGITPALFAGKVTVLNVWGSWCVPCRDEAPLLHALAHDSRIQLVGIDQRDQPENARAFLNRYGNPFVALGADPNGRASIEWGVYGVPETFVIGRDGRIAYKLIGPISPENLIAALKPEIEKALAR